MCGQLTLGDRLRAFARDLPTNKSRVYVRCQAKDGCVIFAPALNNDHAQMVKKELNGLLALQPDFDGPPLAA